MQLCRGRQAIVLYKPDCLTCGTLDGCIGANNSSCMQHEVDAWGHALLPCILCSLCKALSSRVYIL